MPLTSLGNRKKTRTPQQALCPGPTAPSSPCQLPEMPRREWARPSLQGSRICQKLIQGKGPGVPEPWPPAS